MAVVITGAHQIAVSRWHGLGIAVWPFRLDSRKHMDTRSRSALIGNCSMDLHLRTNKLPEDIPDLFLREIGHDYLPVGGISRSDRVKPVIRNSAYPSRWLCRF